MGRHARGWGWLAFNVVAFVLAAAVLCVVGSAVDNAWVRAVCFGLAALNLLSAIVIISGRLVGRRNGQVG
jgi:intracellular septation protein A